MPRSLKILLSFLWLTFGYWILSVWLQIILMLLPFAAPGTGISVHSADGYHTVNFSGSPGDAVLVLVTKAGHREFTFGESAQSSASSSAMIQLNTLFGLIITVLYAAISLPVLTKLLESENDNDRCGFVRPLLSSRRGLDVLFFPLRAIRSTIRFRRALCGRDCFRWGLECNQAGTRPDRRVGGHNWSLAALLFFHRGVSA